MIIKTTEELINYVTRLSEQHYVAIDTEFMREKTYWPMACLIQVASDDGIEFCIDALDKSVDISPFFEILDNPNIVKVFHAARQDIEVFFCMTGTIPHPLFDTQVAGMVCGMGESISYKDIVYQTLRVSIDKGMRHTDWSRRPLDERQIEYAMSDVTHLRDVYKILKKRLDTSGRGEWIREEMDKLADITIYDTNPDDAWHRFKAKGLSTRSLNVLKWLAKWRENKAKEKNRPRNFVLRDNVIQEIAAMRPTNLEELTKVRGIIDGGKYNNEILEAINNALENRENLRDEVAHTSVKNRALFELLKMLLHIKAEEEGVAAKLIASNEELGRIADGEREEIAALTGWRKDIFGNCALELCEGNVGIAYDAESAKTVLRRLSTEG